MNLFKAFAHIGALVNNADGVVAPVGELSPLSKTFSRKMKEYVNGSYPNLTLVSFAYKVNGVSALPPAGTTNSGLEMMSWIYAQGSTGKFTDQKDSFQQSFITQFGAKYDLINSGKMVAFGSNWIPEYIETAPAGQSANNNWKIWFVDNSFFNQYDEIDVIVIPPITPIDQFFGTFTAVKALISAMTMTSILSKVTVAKGAFPETYLRSDKFEWVDTSNAANKVVTEWTTIHYGAAANSLDAVKEAIRTYIMANTQKTREQWAAVFPDLFTSTEFIGVPNYNDYSVENAVRETGVYSGIYVPETAKLLVRKTCKGTKWTTAWADAHRSMIGTQYKSLTVTMVGGPENKNNMNMFKQVYPDYMNVPLTTLDQARMSEATRTFVNEMHVMLQHAEELTATSGVPDGYNRTTRDGVVYLSKNFNGYLWLVVSKFSIVAAYPL